MNSWTMFVGQRCETLGLIGDKSLPKIRGHIQKRKQEVLNCHDVCAQAPVVKLPAMCAYSQFSASFIDYYKSKN